MSRQTLAPGLAALALIAALTGCSLLTSGPARDADGQVTEPSTISATDLLTGDCFTFNSADGSTVAEVTVMPCTEQHDYVVLRQGELTATDVDAAGSLQNAVSESCASTFDDFKAANTADTKPKQEFLVFPVSSDEDANQAYSCISTDPGQSGLAARG